VSGSSEAQGFRFGSCSVRKREAPMLYPKARGAFNS
jgi:hypothetical protein